MAKRFYGSESEGESMMPSGSGALANMPQNVVMREYPKPYDGMPEDLDDSIRGIDNKIKAANSKKRANMKPENS